MHLLVIEIIRPRAAKDREAHRVAKVIRKSSARSEHARDHVRIHRQLHRDARPARHPRRINPFRVHRKALVDIRRHRLCRVQADLPGSIARVVRPRDNVAVFCRRRLVTLHRPPPTPARVERQNNAPLAQRSEVRRQIQRVVLRRVAFTLHIVDNLPQRQALRRHDTAHNHNQNPPSTHADYYNTPLLE